MTVRETALREALKDVGVKEHPPGSNWGPQVKEYLADAGITFPAAWCAAFVTSKLKKAGYKVSTPGPAAVENWVVWGAQHGDLVARPRRADLVCYDWDADNWYDHMGFVVRVLALRWRGRAFAGWIKTVEGNTAVGNDSNGGEVMIRYRWCRKCAFVRIPV